MTGYGQEDVFVLSPFTRWKIGSVKKPIKLWSKVVFAHQTFQFVLVIETGVKSNNTETDFTSVH